LTEKIGTFLRQWLASRPFAAGDRVFSGISVSTVRAVVRRAAAIAFPHPSQSAMRRRIHAVGLRDLFVARVIRSRVAAECLRDLTGVDRLTRLQPYIAQSGSDDRLRGELDRITRRWRPGWI